MIKVIYHPLVPVLQIACTLSFVSMLVAGALREEVLGIGAFAFTFMTGFLLVIFGSEFITAKDTDNE